MKVKNLLPVLALCFLAFATLPVLADETLENKTKALLTDYWAPASATTVICTNVAPSTGNNPRASWEFGRAQMETVTLTIVSTNSSTSDVHVIIGPSANGSQVDHTVNYFKFKGTLSGTTPITVTTNIPSSLLGGAKYGLVYSVQNGHNVPIKLSLTRSGWNR